MEVTIVGRYQFNNVWLKSKTLDEAVKDSKQIDPKIVKTAWERVNGKHKPVKSARKKD